MIPALFTEKTAPGRIPGEKCSMIDVVDAADETDAQHCLQRRRDHHRPAVQRKNFTGNLKIALIGSVFAEWGVGGGLRGLRPPATKWGTKGGSPRWFVTYHGSVSDELLLFIFFILIHGDGDWFFLERFFVFYQSIESLISQSFSVFHIGDRVIIHDFIKVSSSTFFNPGGCTPHEIHI